MTIPRELALAHYKDEVVLTQHPVSKPTYEISCIAPKTGEVGLQGFVRVGYNADRKTVFINEYEAPYEITGNQLHLVVVVDRSSVELFTGDGVRSLTLSTFPEPGSSRILLPFQG
jgi:sucrose-6-phosphate hydrolase SacC (GH32 family)